MSSLPAAERPEVPLFSDGLGDRVVAADAATGDLLQILRLRPALTAVPSFEFALRERAARLANFRHAYYARVRRVDRIMSPAPALAIVSDHLEGTRLSDVLRVAHERRLQLDINAALCLIRQLVPAIAVLHENARDVAHGLIAPERLVVTPNARLLITEHVVGAAIEQLQYSRERLWHDLRIAMPPSAGLPRFDHRADVTGVGLVALALVLGRPLRTDEYPNQLASLLQSARERSALGDEQPLSQPLRGWLARALQLDIRRAFASAPEALAALEEIVADGSMYVAAPVALETFLSRYASALLEPTPEPAFVPQVVPPPIEVLSGMVEDDVDTPAPPIEMDLDVDAALADDEWVIDAPPAPAPLKPAAAVPPPVVPVAPVLPPPSAPVAVAPAAPEPVSGAKPAASGPVDLVDLLGPVGLPAADAATTSALFNPDKPFTIESAPVPVAEPARTKRRVPPRLLAMAALVVLLVGGGAFALRNYAFSGGAALGTLVVQSNPGGVQVFVDGVPHGVTPARFSVSPGSHILELRGRGVPRVIPLNVSAGAEVSQYLEFADSPQTGSLAVQSDPPGARVLVDGADRGVAPTTISNLTPGDHEVVLRSESGNARHVVNVQAGGTASLVVPMAAAATNGPVSGWVTVKSPFTLEIREEGRLLGSSDADRVMMAAGRHDLELVNETLNYRARRTVQVQPGKVVPVAIDLPRGVVNLNAAPWAEVWLDGQRVGETPIGNLSVPIGSHEFVFRHPQFGEKRQAVSVTLGAPVRLSVDMK
jgi:hypothetical protein